MAEENKGNNGSNKTSSTALGANALSGLPAPKSVVAKTAVAKTAKSTKSTTATTAANGTTTTAAKTRAPVSNAVKEKRAATLKAKFNADAKKYGPILYGAENALADADDISEILARVRKSGDITMANAAKLIKAERNAAGPKEKRERYSPNTRNLRKSTRKLLKSNFKVLPSAARITAFLGMKNYNKLNATKKANRNAVKNLLEKIALPEYKGTRKVKANAKARLQELKVDAQTDIEEVTEAKIIKGVLRKAINPAFVKQLAQLRQAGYDITAKNFVGLMTLVKQNKTEEELRVNETMSELIEQGEAMESACDRCVLTTIFGISMN